VKIKKALNILAEHKKDKRYLHKHPVPLERAADVVLQSGFIPQHTTHHELMALREQASQRVQYLITSLSLPA